MFAIAGVLASPGVAEATFGTTGGLNASVIGAQVQRTADDPLSLADSATVTNPSGNSTAAVAYSASLASARVTTSASAVADPASEFDATAFVEADPVSFRDRLTFLIPAGVYETGVDATFHGFAGGALSSFGCTNHNPDPGVNVCSNGFQTITFAAGSSMGNATYDRRLDVNAGGIAAAGLNESFTLTVPLVRAGLVDAPMTVDVVVSGYMSTRGMAANTYSYPFGAQRTLFTSDFSAYLTSVSLQEGIAWTPESDVFLSQPVPEPEAWMMIAGGGALVAARMRRRRKGGATSRARGANESGMRECKT